MLPMQGMFQMFMGFRGSILHCPLQVWVANRGPPRRVRSGQAEGVNRLRWTGAAAARRAGHEIGGVADHGRALGVKRGRRLGERLPAVGLGIIGIEFVERDALLGVLALTAVIE